MLRWISLQLVSKNTHINIVEILVLCKADLLHYCIKSICFSVNFVHCLCTKPTFIT